MWATVSFILGLSFAYWLIVYSESSFFVVAIVFLYYLLSRPVARPSFRRHFPLFGWLRNTHCKLTYAGHKELIFDRTKPRLFVFYPHGAHCIAATLLSSDPEMQHIRVACSEILFWLPIVKEFVCWGNAFSCSAPEISRVLRAGNSVVLYPGGMNEVPNADFLRNGQKQTPYLRRKGFVELAFLQGVDIVPCWVDGEEDLYTVVHPFPRLQSICYRLFRYPWPMITWGWSWLPFFPRASPLTIHVGNVIRVPKLSSPDIGNVVEKLHAQVSQSVVRLASKVRANKIK